MDLQRDLIVAAGWSDRLDVDLGVDLSPQEAQEVG